MPRPSPAALALAERYRLALQRVPPRGPAGERLGKAAGSSLEFHDRRVYQLGDDVRHIDWRAVARTDQLVTRVWREEVLARVELLVDVSRSLAIDPAKAQLTVDLAALFALSAREDGCEAKVIALGQEPRPVPLDELTRYGLTFESRAPFEPVLRAAQALQRRGSMVVLLSDFLFPHDPRALVRLAAARAGTLALVQLLSPSESSPRPGSTHRLVDCETDATLDLVLDEATVAAYLRRLTHLTGALADECRRAGARFTSVVSDSPTEALARERLVPAELLVPR
jgi:uncharacterized protein (DUF58 family)